MAPLTADSFAPTGEREKVPFEKPTAVKVTLEKPPEHMAKKLGIKPSTKQDAAKDEKPKEAEKAAAEPEKTPAAAEAAPAPAGEKAPEQSEEA
ncbi:hypothetical protein DIPPA_20188 [Diplonema papillatum]|nr:hypothetical protein DIPPA_20188 [Diplonema papillatum]